MLRGPAYGTAVPVGQGLYGRAQVAQQVPTIRDLDGVGRALARAVRIGAGAVARDHLDAGVGAQPGRERLGPPVGQQIHDPVALEVDEHRPVAVAAAPRPIIHREHARRWRGLGAALGRADHAPQRVGAGGHGQALGQACSGFAAEREAEVTLQGAEPAGAPRAGGSDIPQAFGEGLPGAGRVEAAEPACLDAQHHRAALPGQVAQGALVMAVDAAGRPPAGGASSHRRARGGDDGDAVGGRQDLHDGQARREQGQDAFGQERLSKRAMFLSCAQPDPEQPSRLCPIGVDRVGRRPPLWSVAGGLQDPLDCRREWFRHIGASGRGDDPLEPEVLAQARERVGEGRGRFRVPSCPPR